MNDDGEEPQDNQEPPIVLVGLEHKSYYLYKGDEYLNQILLVEDNFQRPFCV